MEEHKVEVDMAEGILKINGVPYISDKVVKEKVDGVKENEVKRGN